MEEEARKLCKLGRPRGALAKIRVHLGVFADKNEAIEAGKAWLGGDSKRTSGNSYKYCGCCSRHEGCTVLKPLNSVTLPSANLPSRRIARRRSDPRTPPTSSARGRSTFESASPPNFKVSKEPQTGHRRRAQRSSSGVHGPRHRTRVSRVPEDAPKRRHGSHCLLPVSTRAVHRGYIGVRLGVSSHRALFIL